jgi:Acetyltransferase (GNAT) domain
VGAASAGTSRSFPEQAAESGYSSLAYARALPHMGQAVRLAESGGWLLRQSLGSTHLYDLRGTYPLYCCNCWQNLPADIASLDGSAVSISLVTDPFVDVDEAMLRDCFPDRTYRFKTHYVADLSESPRSFIIKHHRKNAAKALRALEVFESQKPIEYLDTWRQLYANLVQRHNIRGPQRFSDMSFARQFRTPGLRVFIAKDRAAQVVGMILCFTQGGYAYTHLAACNDRGYEQFASFGLMMRVIETLADEGFESVDLGGVAGMVDAGAKVDGLARFKQGWSNTVRSVWFCGRILDRAAYEMLSRTCCCREPGFFPAYRANEYQQYLPTQ